MNADLEFAVEAHDADRRLDRFLRDRLPDLPRGQLFKLLRTGKIRVDGARAEANTRLVAGMRVTVRRAALGDLALSPTPDAVSAGPGLPAEWIVAQDPDVLVIDKPAGLAVHGGQGITDHLVDRVHRHLASTGTSEWPPGFSPAPAHRLDRATSGVVAFGVSPLGLRALAAAFRENRAQKTYLAIVSDAPTPREGVIDLPLHTTSAARGDLPRTHPDPNGSPAVTAYRCAGRNAAGETIIELCPKTGRNHQLRAHLAAVHRPILGDRRYGGQGAPRLWLHAWRLAVDLPELGEPSTRTYTADPDSAFRVD